MIRIKVDERGALAIGVVLGWLLHVNEGRIKGGLGKIRDGVKKVLRLN